MNIQQYELCGYAIDVIIYDHIQYGKYFAVLIVICAKTNSKSDF